MIESVSNSVREVIFDRDFGPVWANAEKARTQINADSKSGFVFVIVEQPNALVMLTDGRCGAAR